MRIEEGKYYLNRISECVGPMTRNTDASLYFWRDQFGRPYFQNGRVHIGLNEHDNDLVKEWINCAGR